jgi:hypothetical protein
VGLLDPHVVVATGGEEEWTTEEKIGDEGKVQEASEVSRKGAR